MSRPALKLLRMFSTVCGRGLSCMRASRARIALAELGAAKQDHRDGVAAIVEFHLVHQLAYQINAAAAIAEAVARKGWVWKVSRVEAAAFIGHAYAQRTTLNVHF